MNKIIPEAGEQGGADEEKDRWKVPGRTGGMKETVCSQRTKGLYGAGTAACGNCPLPAGINKADPAPIAYAGFSGVLQSTTDHPQAARLWCFGTAGGWLINGFVSLIRLSDRTIYHLEDV